MIKILLTLFSGNATNKWYSSLTIWFGIAFTVIGIIKWNELLITAGTTMIVQRFRTKKAIGKQ